MEQTALEQSAEEWRSLECPQLILAFDARGFETIGRKSADGGGAGPSDRLQFARPSAHPNGRNLKRMSLLVRFAPVCKQECSPTDEWRGSSGCVNSMRGAGNHEFISRIEASRFRRRRPRCRGSLTASIKFCCFVSVGERVLRLRWTQSNAFAVPVAQHESNRRRLTKGERGMPPRARPYTRRVLVSVIATHSCRPLSFSFHLRSLSERASGRRVESIGRSQPTARFRSSLDCRRSMNETNTSSWQSKRRSTARLPVDSNPTNRFHSTTLSVCSVPLKQRT